MKTFSILIILSLSFMVTASERLNIGVIDTTKLFRSSVELRSLQNELEHSMRQKQFELEPLQRRITNLRDEIEEKRFVLSEEELERKERELEELFHEFVEKRDEVTDYLSQRERELMGPVLEKLQSIIEEMGKEEGFDIILEKDAVVFYAPELDITEKIIQFLDEKEEASEDKQENGE